MENKNVLNGVLFYSSGGKGGAINIVGKEDDEVKFPGKLAENLNVSIYKDKYPDASEAEIPKIKMTGKNSFESEVCKGIFVPILNENISVVMHITLDNSTIEFESVGKFIAGLSKMSGLWEEDINSEMGRESLRLINVVTRDILAGECTTITGGTNEELGAMIFYYVDTIKEIINTDNFKDKTKGVDTICLEELYEPSEQPSEQPAK